MIAVSKVSALLVGAEPAVAERVGRESLPYGIPVLLCGELASSPGENVFVFGAGPERRGRALARCAADPLKAEMVAVVIDGRNTIAGILATAFVQQCRKNDGPKVREWTYQNEKDFTENISAVVKARPAAVLLAGSPRDCLKMRSELQAAKLMVPVLFGGEDGGAAGLRPEDEGADVYLATAFSIEGLSDKGREFVQRFQEANGEPPTLAAALAYDGTRLLFDAIRQAATANGTRVRDELAKTDQTFESVTGTVSFKDRQARRRIFVLRVKGSEAKLVNTIAADE